MHSESANRTQYEWLALRCQSGEPGAFEDLIAVMERPLLYYAMSLTGAQDSALDVLQEVWIRTFRGTRKLKDPGSLRSWLYSVTHGIAVDRIRKNYSREQAEKGARRTTAGFSTSLRFGRNDRGWIWGEVPTPVMMKL